LSNRRKYIVKSTTGTQQSDKRKEAAYAAISKPSRLGLRKNVVYLFTLGEIPIDIFVII